MRFVFQEGALEVPDDASDDSVQILSIPLADGLPLSLTIRRRSCPSDAVLAELVDAALAEIAERQPSFEVAWRRSHLLDGYATVIVAASYGQGEGAVSQRLVYIGMPDLLLLMTGSVPGQFLPVHLDMLNKIAGSLSFTKR